ncbi:MAG: hypothetical protein QM755_03810 [Luteolibacter sp.]
MPPPSCGARRNRRTWVPTPTSHRCWRTCSARSRSYAGRDRASSPAAGSKAMHYREQKALLEEAFTL